MERLSDRLRADGLARSGRAGEVEREAETGVVPLAEPQSSKINERFSIWTRASPRAPGARRQHDVLERPSRRDELGEIPPRPEAQSWRSMPRSEQIPE